MTTLICVGLFDLFQNLTHHIFGYWNPCSETEAVKVVLSCSLRRERSLFRTNHCSCPKSCLSLSKICYDAENKSSFGDFFILQMLNLIRKEKVILRGLERMGGEKGGHTTAAAARKSRQQWSIEVRCRKGETKKKLGQSVLFVCQMLLWLMDFMLHSCFSLLKLHFIHTKRTFPKDHCLLFDIENQNTRLLMKYTKMLNGAVTSQLQSLSWLNVISLTFPVMLNKLDLIPISPLHIMDYEEASNKVNM